MNVKPIPEPIRPLDFQPRCDWPNTEAPHPAEVALLCPKCREVIATLCTDHYGHVLSEPGLTDLRRAILVLL